MKITGGTKWTRRLMKSNEYEVAGRVLYVKINF